MARAGPTRLMDASTSRDPYPPNRISKNEPAPSSPPPISHRSSSSSSTSTSANPSEVNILACFRESPRPCINQALVDALKPMREERADPPRFATAWTAGDHRSISYATAISVIIGTPWKITSVEQAKKLPKTGEKIAEKIEEFLRTGRIAEADRAAKSLKNVALKEMSSVHGVGYVMANNLYANGFRTLDDMNRSGKWEKQFRWHDDLQQKMPRSEVESIAEFLKIQLEKTEPGATTMLCGGYRRGKTESNDLDLLITYKDQDGKERGVLKRLVERLIAKGFIPPDGVLTFHEPASKRTTTSNRPARGFDSLDKALIVFRHPANGTTRMRDHWRRVDLIVARWPQWGAAVVGWSGSTQFERDLRIQAQRMGYKFDSGGLRKLTGEVVATASEGDVFKALKIPYIPPHLRNADP